ncbi:carboxypeptidase-like regulatory domain-containing protein [Chitinophaga sp. MM2321]|uniref:carboxypeptidase-like regulatory domain-containing protein n=1 Tax=Chitinophaga sp. MM2321 TaxID=3137178 RepID=UPI0032D584E8
MLKKNLWLLAICLTSLLACDKRMATVDNPPEVTPPVIVPDSPISPVETTTGIQGLVLDENNQPLQGAQVKCGNKVITTDAKGAFLLENITVIEAAAVLTAEKDGYFKGVRTFTVAGENKIQYTQLQLLPKKTAGSFDAATGGNINASNAQFIFVPQQVLNSDNSLYTGKVDLLYAPINPERADFADIMPGDLRAINNSNALVGLQSFGMMALELRGENGEKLHLDTTKAVTFKLEIPTSLRSTAPATIPLWHFDEATGVWIEEGSATKTGDNYIGTVKHFSFWNCDAQFPIIPFKAVLQNNEGIPLANMFVRMVRENDSYATAYTNIEGEVSGSIPSNESLTMVVYNRGVCSQKILSKKIGPFSDKTDIGIIKTSTPDIITINISGNVTTCDGTPVAKGRLTYTVDGVRSYAYISQGTYATSFIRCQAQPAEIILNAVDEVNNKMATTTAVLGIGNHVRNLQVCETIEASFADFVMNGETYSFVAPPDTLSVIDRGSDTTRMFIADIKRASSSPTNEQLNFNLGSMQVGTSRIWSFYVLANNQDYYGDNISCTITQTGTLGEYVQGSVSGNVTRYSPDTLVVPISGTFRIRIQ